MKYEYLILSQEGEDDLCHELTICSQKQLTEKQMQENLRFMQLVGKDYNSGCVEFILVQVLKRELVEL